MTTTVPALPAAIQAELDRIRNEVTEPVAGMRAEISTMAQAIAKLSGYHEDGSRTAAAGDRLGSRAVVAFAQDPAFTAAAETVQRGMKPGKFSARINLDGSIRAALTTGGRGGVGDTEYPGAVERRSDTPVALPPLRLLDALPSRPVSTSTVEFVQVNVASGDAAEQAKEGDVKAEIDIEGTLATANIATVAAWTSASRQVLSDERSLESSIDNLLRYKVLSKLEALVLTGAGGVNKILGIIPQAMAFTPTIGTTPADRIGEALMIQSNAGYAPNLVVMNPSDWFRLQITRTNDEDEEYVFGSPTAPAKPSLWTMPIVTSPFMPAGQALTIDTAFVTVLDREQLSVVVATEHADFFVRNLIAILGEMRAGLEVVDGAAVRLFTLTPPSGP